MLLEYGLAETSSARVLYRQPPHHPPNVSHSAISGRSPFVSERKIWAAAVGSIDASGMLTIVQDIALMLRNLHTVHTKITTVVPGDEARRLTNLMERQPYTFTPSDVFKFYYH